MLFGLPSRFQPDFDDFREVGKGEVFGAAFEFFADFWQVPAETGKPFGDFCCAGEGLSLRGAGEPVANFGDCFGRIATMGMDVPAGDIGNGGPVAVGFAIEDEAGLAALGFGPEALAGEVEPEFERHVEAWQVGSGTEPDGGKIADAVSALADDAHDFFQAHFAGVVYFQAAAGDESEVGNGENDGVKNRLVRVIEGAIDEYVVRPDVGRPSLFTRETFANGGGDRLFYCLGAKAASDCGGLNGGESVRIFDQERTVAPMNDDLTGRLPFDEGTGGENRFPLHWEEAALALGGHTLAYDGPSTVFRDHVRGFAAHIQIPLLV